MSYEFKNESNVKKSSSIKTRDEMFRHLYQAYNAPLFPLKYRTTRESDRKIIGKAPAKRSWQTPTEATCYEDLGIDGTRQNAGLITGDVTKLIVVDVDDCHLFDSKHQLPETFTISTGRGFHHYFRIPEDRLNGSLKSSVNKNDGFNIRANGGYVVAPGSIHKETGKKYKIIDENIPIVNAPQWVIDWATKESSESVKREKIVNRFVEVNKHEVPKQYSDSRSRFNRDNVLNLAKYDPARPFFFCRGENLAWVTVFHQKNR